MAERFLIDTSAIIKYLKKDLPENGELFLDNVLDDESNISFITEIELQVWNPSNENDLSIYKSFIENSNIIKVDDYIIQKTIDIRKLYRLKLPDALIASTAIVNDFTLVADNDKDFKKVTELKYINAKFL